MVRESSRGGATGVRGRTGTYDAKRESGEQMSDEPQPQPQQNSQGWAPREPHPGPGRGQEPGQGQGQGPGPGQGPGQGPGFGPVPQPAPGGKQKKQKRKRTGWRRIIPTWRMLLGTFLTVLLLLIGLFALGYYLVKIPP